MAESDHLNRFRPAAERDRIHRHRVDIIQQIRARTDLLHRIQHNKEIFQRAKSAEDTAGPHGIGNDLIDAVFFRDRIFNFLKINSAGTENCNHIIRPFQRLAQIGRRHRFELHIELFGNDLPEFERDLQTFPVDIHQNDFRTAAERLIQQNVLDEILREDHATRTDNCDSCHKQTPFLR